MTSDVVLVRADTPYCDVVNLLLNSRVSAVPVVDRFGRPVGVRSDAEIRRDVFEEVFRSILSIEQGKVIVETSNAVVRLGGRTHFRSTADKAVRLARQVPGVVGVVNDLAFDVDDRMAVGSDRGVPLGVA